jgi:nucleotide-binding universal stress UspA family protein
MIQTLLTPIDGSMHAQAALELSIDLATKYDAQIVLLHVGVRDGNVSEELYDTASRELEKAESNGEETGINAQQSRHLQILEYLGRMLLRNAHEHAEGKGVRRVETAIDFGEAGECILHYAKQRSADLIVMGSRGFSELKGLFLGSVSHKVFHLATCSCVTVHGSDEQPSLDGFKNILVPTDGSEQADKAVELASDIASKYGAKLELLYVTWRGPSLEKLRASIDMDQLSHGVREELDPERHPIAEHVSSTFIPPVVSKEVSREIGEQVLERGRRTAESKGVPAPKLVLQDGDPARVIAGTARREQADLIVMGSRGLGGVEGLLTGSVSYKVSHTVPCSCMIIR